MQRYIICLFIFIGLWSCKTDVNSDAQNAVVQNEADIQSYISKNGLTAQKTVSGLYYQIKKANANGDKSAVGNTVTFHYTLFKINAGGTGTPIDSSSRINNVPATTIFGINLNIYGLEEALSILKSGEKAIILMPNELAFGSQSSADLPAFSAIGLEIEILKTRTEDQQIEDYIAIKKLTVTEKTASNLRIIKTLTNTNAQVETGKTYQVNYTGKRLNDVIFDSGTISVTLGLGSTIKGFEEGISKMRVGEKATLIFPSTIGYGTAGSGSKIPPYSPLIFDIEILK